MTEIKDIEQLQTTTDSLLILMDKALRKITQMDNEIAKVNSRLDKLEQAKPEDKGMGVLA